MGKKKGHADLGSDIKGTLFVAGEKAVDPALASLFALSLGPVKFTKEAAVEAVQSDNSTHKPFGVRASNGTHSEDADDALSNGDAESSASEQEIILAEEQVHESDSRPRKRRRIDEGDDLESQYLSRLAREEAQDQVKHQHLKKTNNCHESSESEEDTEGSDGEGATKSAMKSWGDGVPLHETIDNSADLGHISNTARTIFLGNVSTDAIKSKSARKTLEKHLANVIESLPKHQPPHKVESLRFRSTAFVSGAGPKKAAFAKKELMEETTKSTNAYVVYSNEIAAKESATKLNGAIVLDRHLRADCLATPAKVDHRRCIFVGNLSFVDEETVNENPGDDRTTAQRPKAKVPADAEEGLWRTFSKVGIVESVRVIRDKETRIGKGFAYVQFIDENGVEAALLMNDKKFPPMLPRKLRVMRARKTRQRQPQPVREIKKSGSKSSRGKSGFSAQKDGPRAGFRPQGESERPSTSGFRKPESFIFEGSRASSSSKSRNGVLKRKKRPAVKPTSRSSRRGAAFKAAGGKRTSESK